MARRAARVLRDGLEGLAKDRGCNCIVISLLNPMMRKYLRDRREATVDLPRPLDSAPITCACASILKTGPRRGARRDVPVARPQGGATKRPKRTADSPRRSRREGMISTQSS